MHSCGPVAAEQRGSTPGRALWGWRGGGIHAAAAGSLRRRGNACVSGRSACPRVTEHPRQTLGSIGWMGTRAYGCLAPQRSPPNFGPHTYTRCVALAPLQERQQLSTACRVLPAGRMAPPHKALPPHSRGRRAAWCLGAARPSAPGASRRRSRSTACPSPPAGMHACVRAGQGGGTQAVCHICGVQGAPA